MQGEVFSFPTMDGKAFNAWGKSWDELNFVPNGWGALLIVSNGRLFDWFPWCAYASTNVAVDKEPKLDDVLLSKLMFRGGSRETVGTAVPRKAHFERMRLTKIGELELNSSVADSLIDTLHFGPKSAVMCDWSICSEAFNADTQHATGMKVRKLVKKPNNNGLSNITNFLKNYF